MNVLTTTRSVRKRLDLEKPVPREVLLECLELALQAPTGSNAQGWQWVFVDDPEKKKALADIYRTNATPYLDQPKPEYGDVRDEQRPRVHDSAKYLNEHLHEVPVMLIPCLEGRPDGAPAGSGVVLGLTAARGVELHAGVALARARVGVDDAAPARRRREAGRRSPRHSVRQVQPGRPVPDRLHQGHRLPSGQAAARRAGHALEQLVVRQRR